MHVPSLPMAMHEAGMSEQEQWIRKIVFVLLKAEGAQKMSGSSLLQPPCLLRYDVPVW